MILFDVDRLSFGKLNRHFNVSGIAYFHELIEAAAEAVFDLDLHVFFVLEFGFNSLIGFSEVAEVLLKPGAAQIFRLRRATSQLSLIGSCLALTIMLMDVVLIFDEVHERVILSNFPDVVILEAFLVKRALDDSLLVQGLYAASAHGVAAGQR